MKLQRREEPEDDIELEEDRELDNSWEDDLGLNDYGGDFGASPPMERHAELLKQLMNFDPYLKGKFNGWLGISWNDKTERYEKDTLLQPIMNEKGAGWCISFLNTYARDNNIITNIGKEEYMNFCLDLIENVCYNLGTRYEEFGIKTEGDRIRVTDELLHSAYLVLMGSGDGKASKILTETTTRSEHLNQNPMMGYPMMQPQQQKRGFMSKIKSIFGGN